MPLGRDPSSAPQRPPRTNARDLWVCANCEAYVSLDEDECPYCDALDAQASRSQNGTFDGADDQDDQP